MPYKDPAIQRAYMRQWIADRRAAFFAGKVCAECGNTKNLELDHEDPSVKITHRIWSWAEARREAELAKCRPLCKDCHDIKSAGEHAKGERAGNSKLTANAVAVIRNSMRPTRELSTLYGVNMRTIQRVRKGERWKHIKVS